MASYVLYNIGNGSLVALMDYSHHREVHWLSYLGWGGGGCITFRELVPKFLR